MATTKTKTKTKITKLKAVAAAEKATIKTRTDCSSLVGNKASQSPIWQAQGALQDSGAKLVAAGLALGDADQKSIKADSDASAARTVRETAVVEWNSAFDVYSANVSKYAPLPQDVTALALAVQERTSYLLVVPLGIDVKFDAVKSDILIHVKHAPGMRACEIGISANPANPTSWKRVKGNGARRVVSGYAPGTYWVRACSVRGSDESDYTAPVAVVVK